MKRITATLLFTSFYFLACAQVSPAQFKNLSWLVGEWHRTNTKPGKTETERWTKNSLTELRGLNIQLSGKDTTAVEKTRLIIKDGAIYYVAGVPENKALTYFKITAITDHSFTCENAAHDFPKMIAYSSEGKKLKATISGNGKSIDYFFDRK